MPTPGANTDFDLDLAATLARLRIYALSLTRNGDRADDLVQQTVLKALTGRESFQPGTNFAGWIFRMVVSLNESLLDERLAQLEKARPWTARLISKLESHIRSADDEGLYRINPFSFAKDKNAA